MRIQSIIISTKWQIKFFAACTDRVEFVKANLRKGSGVAEGGMYIEIENELTQSNGQRDQCNVIHDWEMVAVVLTLVLESHTKCTLSIKSHRVKTQVIKR